MFRGLVSGSGKTFCATHHVCVGCGDMYAEGVASELARHSAHCSFNVREPEAAVMYHQTTALRFAACWQLDIRPFSQQDPIQNCSGWEPSLGTKLSRQNRNLPALLMCDGLKLCFHNLSANISWLRRSNKGCLIRSASNGAQRLVCSVLQAVLELS